MIKQSDNCSICSEEFLLEELKSLALSTFNITKFKICKNCLDKSDPQDDYLEVRKLVASYLK